MPSYDWMTYRRRTVAGKLPYNNIIARTSTLRHSFLGRALSLGLLCPLFLGDEFVTHTISPSISIPTYQWCTKEAWKLTYRAQLNWKISAINLFVLRQDWYAPKSFCCARALAWGMRLITRLRVAKHTSYLSSVCQTLFFHPREVFKLSLSTSNR